MATQWARQEAKKDELAGVVQRGVDWVALNRQKSLMGGGAVLAAVIIASVAGMRYGQRREASWERLAIAQSLAYQGKPEAVNAAMEQIKRLQEEFADSAPAGFGTLFAGDVLYRQGRLAEASQAYQSLMDRGAPSSAVPFAAGGLALTLEAKGDFAGAAQAAQNFLDQHQDHFLAPQTHACLARCLMSTGQREKAKASWERMALLYPDTYWANWAKGQLGK